MEINLQVGPYIPKYSPLSYFQIGILIIDVDIIRLH